MAGDIVQTARELLDALGGRDQADDRVDRLVQTFAASLADADAGAARKAMAMLASAVYSLPPHRAGIVARLVGAMLEAGHDPAPAQPAMLGALQQMLPVCASLREAARAQVGAPPAFLDEDEAEEWVVEREPQALNEVAARRPAAAAAWQRLHAIWPGAIALFSVDPQARAEAQDLAPIAERIEDVHEAAGWLRAMLSVLHDEPYVAIEPATRTGIAGRMSGIVENFQLDVLLMAAFPGGEERVSPAALAVARGEGPQRVDETVTAAWNLYTYEALRPGGELPDPTDPAYAHAWIWHEGIPAGIPALDGHRVILLGPAPNPRTWPAQRMFLKLPAQMTAEPLGEDAVAQWLARIDAAVAAGATR